jgi:hypothetical protein
VDDCEDTEATSGSLGECTFKLVLNDKGDAKDDDILFLDSDKQLLWEVVELFQNQLEVECLKEMSLCLIS